jgi:Met-zincin
MLILRRVATIFGRAISGLDYASPFSDPIEKMFIARHRLRKKDPSQKLSEPVKPIVYYLDNGTPEPIRSALLDGARWWNQAYEAAGYKDAFRVEVLPDSADPMDIRYNVINWVHRSTRGWSYGSTVTDPRTGEIIKGQVSLGSLRVRQDYLIFTGLLAPFETGKPANPTMEKAALQRLRQLSAHEVGHTLGLMHNYASSVNDRASVMDYPHPSVNLNDKGDLDFSQVYTNEIGAWDKRAIIYGYSDFGKNADESAELNKILEENTRLGLLYIADADARAADGMHPHAHLWDNGKDPVTELENVMRIRKKALDNFSENVIRPNVPMSRLEDALVPIYNYHRYQLESVCKLIGGMDYSYAVRGDKQTAPKLLSAAIQNRALEAVVGCLSAENLEIPEKILQIIPPRPPQYYNIGELMPKRSGFGLDHLAAAEAFVSYELMFLLNPQRANRLVQQKAIDPKNLGFDDVLTSLMKNLWIADLNSNGIKRQIQLQNRHMFITHLLALTQSDQTNYAVKSLCFNILQVMKSGKYTWATDKESEAHQQYMIERINNPKDIPLPQHKEIPPGAPIGCEDDRF